MSRWGNPTAPKFWAGPKEWSPWNQEFSWKARCRKENKEFDAKVAAATGDVQDNGVSLNLSATNPELTNSMPAASLGNVMREQAKLKSEFRGLMEMLSAKHEQELRAKVLAEQEAKAHEVEKQKIEAEVNAYKKTVAQLKRRTLSSSASSRRGLNTGRSRGPGSPLAALGASVVSINSRR